MPTPIELCIEDIDAPADSRVYVRCVAIAGGEPGLAIGAAGEILWQRDEAAACEIWVSLDEQLIVFRPEGAPPIAVSRTGRRLDAPCGKPVVALDQDELEIGRRHFRLHVHGEAVEVSAPTVVEPGPIARMARAAVAAMALAAAAGGCVDAQPGKTHSEVWPITEARPAKTPAPPITVRDMPPKVEMRKPPPAAPSPAAPSPANQSAPSAPGK